MANPDTGNTDLIRQIVEKNHMGDEELQEKPGKAPIVENDDDKHPAVREEDPQRVEHVPGRDPQTPDPLSTLEEDNEWHEEDADGNSVEIDRTSRKTFE